MIYVAFDPEQLEGEDKVLWAELIAKAETARGQLLEDYRNARQKDPMKKPSLVVDGKVYGDIKTFLFDKVFYGKCAWCELKIAGYYPEAEHYRPKGAVSDASGKVSAIYEDGQTRLHPGYFWLSYEWYNLLPACHFCNASAEGKVSKGTRFPVRIGHRFLEDPEPEGTLEDPIPLGNTRHYLLGARDLDVLEQPLLLHPFRDKDLSKHLTFDVDIEGEILGCSEEGRKTIELCQLDREELRTSRALAQRAHYRNHLLRLNVLLIEHPLPNAEERAQTESWRALSAKEPFSAAIAAMLTSRVGSRPD